MSDAGPMVVRKAPIWMKVLLALSLAANFAVIGVMGGIAYKVFPVVQEGPPGGGRGGIVPFVAALEPDQRRALGLKLRDEFRAAGPRVDMRQLVVIVETEPFDRRAAWTIIETHGQTTQQRVEIT